MDGRLNLSALNSLQDLALPIPVEWLVRILVLVSMTLQLLLVVCGARRYRSSSPVLRSVVCLAYLSADAVAISALGTMIHNARSEMYGIWAPLLLLHLGGPDAITAYSTADNELWLRHGFNMVYQVSVAVYVMFLSALEGWSLASAILLLMAGASKYGERTAALRFASYSHMVKSTLPLYHLMQLADERRGITYIIMGEKDINARVTIEDLKEKGIEATDYTLCLSHALFKLYKRRFVSLYFHEGNNPEIRKFLLSLTPKEAFRTVEMELKFMYDVLYSKSSGTAFSRWGALLRLFNAILLGVACFLLFRGLRVKEHKNAQQAITSYVLITVALLVEIYQICRIMASDWTRVRFICAHVQHMKDPQRCIKWCRVKLVVIALCLLRKVQNLVGGRYWKNEIQQYCVIQTCLNSSPCLWKMAGFYEELCSYIVNLYIKVKHINTDSITDEFREFIFEILKEKCSTEENIETCRERVYNFEQFLFTGEFESLRWAAEYGVEDAILIWHIATTLCDMKIKKGNRKNENKNVGVSRTLSRYCAYLLVSRPNLLPLHADLARNVYTDIHFSIIEFLKKHDVSELEKHTESSVLGNGTELARQLLKIKEEEGRWKLIAKYWAELLIYIAVYSKVTFHAECMAAGGEFVSQVWVLLGHMGCGELSDSAVSKKMDDKITKEKEEKKKKRRVKERAEERVKRERVNSHAQAVRAAPTIEEDNASSLSKNIASSAGSKMERSRCAVL